MKKVVYEDKHGYLRRVLLRDEDDESMAQYGIPCGPPDIESIDWEAIKREINNHLVRSNVTTRTELQRTKSLETIAVIVKRHVDSMFREKATEDKARNQQFT